MIIPFSIVKKDTTYTGNYIFSRGQYWNGSSYVDVANTYFTHNDKVVPWSTSHIQWRPKQAGVSTSYRTLRLYVKEASSPGREVYKDVSW